MMTSPIVVLVAAIGIESLRQSGRKLEALLIGGALACGVLGSAALIYHDTNLMPTDRYEELLAIGDRFAGDGPALLPEFDEFGLYALDELAPSGPGFSAKPLALTALADGSGTAYGGSYDVDALDRAALAGYPLVVSRRRPDSSRPPSGYRLAFHGTYYDVWKRAPDAPEVLGSAAGGRGFLAAGVVPCARIGGFADQARSAGGSLRYAERPEVVVVDPTFARKLPAGWGRLEGGGVGLGSPGRVRQPFEVPRSGRYRVWLKGDFGRPIAISVDSHRIGEAGEQSGNAGNYARPFDVDLTAGRHTLTIDRPDGWPPATAVRAACWPSSSSPIARARRSLARSRPATGAGSAASASTGSRPSRASRSAARDGRAQRLAQPRSTCAAAASQRARRRRTRGRRPSAAATAPRRPSGAPSRRPARSGPTRCSSTGPSAPKTPRTL